MYNSEGFFDGTIINRKNVEYIWKSELRKTVLKMKKVAPFPLPPPRFSQESLRANNIIY